MYINHVCSHIAVIGASSFVQPYSQSFGSVSLLTNAIKSATHSNGGRSNGAKGNGAYTNGKNSDGTNTNGSEIDVGNANSTHSN